jgi:hypothetical protein
MAFQAIERKVIFTDQQMLQARNSGRFKDHRAFVRWLFRGQHKMVVTDYDKLVFQYINDTAGNRIEVTGLVGQNLEPK